MDTPCLLLIQCKLISHRPSFQTHFMNFALFYAYKMSRLRSHFSKDHPCKDETVPHQRPLTKKRLSPKTTLLPKDHPHQRPPPTIDHPHQQPPLKKRPLTIDHPHQRPPLTTDHSPKTTLTIDHSHKRSLTIWPPLTIDHPYQRTPLTIDHPSQRPPLTRPTQ